MAIQRHIRISRALGPFCALCLAFLRVVQHRCNGITAPVGQVTKLFLHPNAFKPRPERGRGRFSLKRTGAPQFLSPATRFAINSSSAFSSIPRVERCPRPYPPPPQTTEGAEESKA